MKNLLVTVGYLALATLVGLGGFTALALCLMTIERLLLDIQFPFRSALRYALLVVYFLRYCC